MMSDPPTRMTRSDVVAGMSVALLLIPQSMAYAELAGLPPHHGLYAATFPLIFAAFWASSPYLQTGPVALTGLLTFGALVPLAQPGTTEYAALAALLALVVGVARIGIGLLKAGWLVYLMSHAMMTGFLSGAAVLIISSQLPGALGSVGRGEGNVLQDAWLVLSQPGSWEPTAVVLSVVTVVLINVASRVHPLVPGVLIAAVAGLAYSLLTGYGGSTVGEIPRGLPPLGFDLPWGRLPSLIVPGLVISMIGFAEGVSISRLFAGQERQRWDASREFLSKGVANVVAAFSAGLPVGGSLSRTSVNRLAGARSRWSGLVTGVAVLCFLPVAPVLSALPRATLASIVIAALWRLLRPTELLRLWRLSRPQAFVAWFTFGATLVMAPQIDRAVLMGVAVSAVVHLWWELKPSVSARREGAALVFEPKGVLWFGSAPALEDEIFGRLAAESGVERVVVRCQGLGRIDLSGAYTLSEMLEQARGAGIEMTVEGVPDHAASLLRVVGVLPGEPPE
jgi:SulP family sulfate permease